MSTLVVFVDTNILLHYKRLEQIDWLALTQEKAVLIALPPVIFRELNKQKETNPSHRLRKRAQAVLVSLGDLFKTGSTTKIRPGVHAECIVHEPLIDFTAHQLRVDLQDDFLLASILDYRLRHSGSDCRLVTADIGLGLKAPSKQIDVISLPDDLKLPEEEDPNEKLIRELEGEIRELKHRVPSLRLCFNGKSDVLKFCLTKPGKLVPSEIERQMDGLRCKHPKMDIPCETPAPTPFQVDALKMAIEMMTGGRRDNLLGLHAKIPQDAIQRYNDELDKFYSDYRRYIEASSACENLKLRTICLNILILNEGTTPAEDVDILLHFPDGFRVFDGMNLPRAPEPPGPPDTPKTGLQSAQEGLARIGAFSMPRPMAPRQPNIIPPPNVSSPSIRRTNSYEVSVHITKIKHGFGEALTPLYVVFDTFEEASSFQIDCSLHAGNMPKPVKNKLHVVVEKSASGSP